MTQTGDQKQNTLAESFAKGFNQKKFEDFLIEFRVSQDLAFEAVENPYSIKMIKLLNSRARLFKRDSLKTRILQTFDKLKQERRKIISNVKSKINFTQDIWTARNGLAFLAITCHYLDDNWAYQTFLLDFIPMPGSHSGELICEKFIKCVKVDFKIDEKRLGAIVADNATNNDSFVKHLSHRYGFQKTNQIRCFPHVSNRGVQDGLQHIKAAIEALRNGIKYVRLSQNR